MKSKIALALALMIAATKASRHLLAQESMLSCFNTNRAEPIHKCFSQLPPDRGARLSQTKEYSLAELVSIAEETNPTTRAAWERAIARAAAIGIEKSALFPVLSFVAASGDLRTINPFPKPLAPRGFTVVEIPSVAVGFELNYVVVDFGLRKARIDQARFEALAASSEFVRQNQIVTFEVALVFFRVQAAEEVLEAAEQSLNTATATQQAAEAQLRTGRATLPDVLQARAETAQAGYKLQAAEGEVSLAKVALTRAVGADPSPNILIDRTDSKSSAPEQEIESSEALVNRAAICRPDLKAEVERLRASEAKVREARSVYHPRIEVQAAGSQTAEWPTADFGQLGAANVSTWNASLKFRWDIFDGGRRGSKEAEDRALVRVQAATVREKKDAAEAEVWTAYFDLLTAAKQQRAARQLLEAAQASYDASLQAFQLGVKDLIDVVTAERSLADARSTQATARAKVMTMAVQLEFSTGDLLSGSRLAGHCGMEDRK